MRSLATMLRHETGELRGRAGMRAVLVLLIVLFQGIEIGGGAGWTARLWILPTLCLTGLATSLGFSAARQQAVLGTRAAATERLRLGLPIYAVAILAAAFALGPALTSEGLAGYFGDAGVYAYLLNLIGWPHYELPGVFEYNDLPEIVNAAVWMLPVAALLLAVACLPASRRAFTRLPALLAIVVALVALVVQGLDRDFSRSLDLSALLLQGDGLSVVMGALVGMAAARSAARVPFGAGPAAILLVTVLAAAAVGNPGWLGSAAFRIAISVPAAYLVLFLTFRPLPLLRLSRRIEPVLPGLFLLAWPVQQTVAQVLPLGGGLAQSVLSGLIALLLAAAFWRLIGQRLAPAGVRAAAISNVADAPFLASLRRWRRWRGDHIAQALLIPLVIGIVFTAMMVLIYIAIQPEGS